MAENTDLIREKLNIVDFIRQYVQLSPAGKNFKGLCPFHKEKSPSFIVSPDRQIWHCFGCNAGGDVISFLMKYENIEFIEALRTLAEKAGISLRLVGSSDQKKYDALYEINRVAKDFFKSSLHEDLGRPASPDASRGGPAMRYLTERGLTKETIDEFEIGLALPTSDALTRHLTKMGFAVTDIERAGISFKTERGTYWDRFRNRIMFPLNNNFGKVVGFTGRVMPARQASPPGVAGGPGNDPVDIPKYVNSPETPIFNKSKLLFGFFKSKNFIREQNTAVLVEGQMDFLMAWQDGVKDLVATSGTALTAEHLKTLRRLAENLVLSFDNDSAGRAAAERTIDLGEANDFNVKVILFKETVTPTLADEGKVGVPTPKGVGKDPADIVKEQPGRFTEMISEAVPAMEYYFDFYGVSKKQEISQRKKSIRQALSKIKVISSPVEQQHWLGELSLRCGLPETILNSEMATLKLNPEIKASGEQIANIDDLIESAPTRVDLIVRRLLSLLIVSEALVPQLVNERELLPPQYLPLLDYICKTPKDQPKPELAPMINLIYLQSSFGDPTKAPTEFNELMSQLKNERKNELKRELQEQIRQAEKAKDESLLDRLLRQYHALISGNE